MDFMASIYKVIASGFNLEIENVSIVKDNEIIVYLADRTTAHISLER